MGKNRYFKCEKCNKKNKLYDNAEYIRCWCCNYVTNTEKLKKKDTIITKGSDVGDVWTPIVIDTSSTFAQLRRINTPYQLDDNDTETDYEYEEPEDNEE